MNWPLGDAWDYDGPTLFTLFGLYKPDSSMDAVLAAIDEEIARITSDGIDEATLKRVKTKMLADYYNGLDAFISRADALAKAQVLWGDANVLNRVPAWIDAVKPEDLKRVAGKYLVPANRVAIDRVPAPAAAANPNPK